MSRGLSFSAQVQKSRIQMCQDQPWQPPRLPLVLLPMARHFVVVPSGCGFCRFSIAHIAADLRVTHVMFLLSCTGYIE